MGAVKRSAWALASLVVGCALLGSAATWTVDDDGVEYPGADFVTIQAAINAASPGDTILVYPGTYTEHLVIMKDDLTVESVQGRDLTFITGTHSAFPGYAEVVLVGISGNGVTFRGFALKGVYTGGHDYTVSVYGNNVSVVDNEIIGDPASLNMDVGIQVWRGSDGAILEGNIIRSMAHSGISVGGSTLASNVIIRNNQIFDTARDYGIAIDRATGCIIEENRVEGAASAGIYVVNRAGRSVAGTSVHRNTVINNHDRGIRIRGEGGLVDDISVSLNTISGNVRGIHVEGSTGIGSDVTIQSNCIFGNSAWGLQNTQGVLVDARSNWWGHSSGPSGTGPGLGDPISASVLFDPWLTISPPCGPVSPILPGDVNGDGVVDVRDVVLVYQAVMGLVILTPEQQAAADVNCDGVVDLTDAQWIAEALICLRTLSACP